MPATSRWALRYPSLTDSADVPRDIQNLAMDLDGVAMDSSGLFANRPVSTSGAPGKNGRYFFATDTVKLYRDTGTSWTEIGPGTVPDASLTEPKYITDSVSQRALANLSVGTPELIDLGVTTGKLADLVVTLGKVSNTLKPSQGAGAATEALRALGTTPGTAAAGDRDFSKTFQAGHTFAVPGDILVPSGEDNVIPPFSVPKTAPQTVKLARVRFRLNNGAVGITVSFKIQRNGADAAGFGTTAAPLVTTTSTAWAETNPADVVLTDNDSIQLVVTAISGAPKNLSATVILEHVI